MKKNIILITIIIVLSSHLNAMEMQAAPCFFKGMPVDILNLIANLLTFDDIESEQEFINREKKPSCHPNTLEGPLLAIDYFAPEELIKCTEALYTLKMRQLSNSRIAPLAWLKKHKNIPDKEDMDLAVYSPNNAICAMTYYQDRMTDKNKPYNLSIVDTKTNQELHTICLKSNDTPKKLYEHLAISSSGNIFATIYSKLNERYGLQPFIEIQNLGTQKKDCPDFPTNIGYNESIAFNKQGTHLIIQSQTCDDESHIIIPLTTTLDSNVPQKTLAHYFAQKMVCKNFDASIKQHNQLT